MTAVTKLLGLVSLLVVAQCVSIAAVELVGAWGIFLTIPIGLVVGILICWILNK